MEYNSNEQVWIETDALGNSAELHNPGMQCDH